jgi:hypothetical protein
MAKCEVEPNIEDIDESFISYIEQNHYITKKIFLSSRFSRNPHSILL